MCSTVARVNARDEGTSPDSRDRFPFELFSDNPEKGDVVVRLRLAGSPLDLFLSGRLPARPWRASSTSLCDCGPVFRHPSPFWSSVHSCCRLPQPGEDPRHGPNRFHALRHGGSCDDVRSGRRHRFHRQTPSRSQTASSESTVSVGGGPNDGHPAGASRRSRWIPCIPAFIAPWTSIQWAVTWAIRAGS